MIQLLVSVDGLKTLRLRAALAASDVARLVGLAPQVRQERHGDDVPQDRETVVHVLLAVKVGISIACLGHHVPSLRSSTKKNGFSLEPPKCASVQRPRVQQVARCLSDQPGAILVLAEHFRRPVIPLLVTCKSMGDVDLPKFAAVLVVMMYSRSGPKR